MFLTRGFIFPYEAVREWEAKLTPALAENLRRKRKDRVGRSWYIDETRCYQSCTSSSVSGRSATSQASRPPRYQ